MTTTEQHITVLKHLANGRDSDWVATVTKLPQAVVERFADEAGWPDPDRLVSAIEALSRSTSAIPERVNHSINTSATVKPRPAPRPDLSVARQAPAAPQPAPAVEHREPTMSAGELIVAASRSPKKRTQALGVKVAALLGDLTRILRDEEQQTEAARKAAAEDAKRKARIEQLEQELAALKGQKPRERHTSNIGGATHGDYPCREQNCDRTFTTLQGINLHRRRAHGLGAMRATDAA